MPEKARCAGVELVNEDSKRMNWMTPFFKVQQNSDYSTFRSSWRSSSGTVKKDQQRQGYIPIILTMAQKIERINV